MLIMVVVVVVRVTVVVVIISFMTVVVGLHYSGHQGGGGCHGWLLVSVVDCRQGWSSWYLVGVMVGHRSHYGDGECGCFGGS